MGGWAGGVWYHDNSKICASIYTKLGLQVQVVTISSRLNFGRRVSPERGSAAGWKFLVPPTTASAQCLRLSEGFSFYMLSFYNKIFKITIGRFPPLGRERTPHLI